MNLRTGFVVRPLLALPGLFWHVCASAHVKWFAQWDIICPPRDPMRVVSDPLWQAFFSLAVLVMGLLAGLDWCLSRADCHLNRLLDKVHQQVFPKAILILRCGMCAYWLLVSLTMAKPVYLTPELLAPGWVRWVQLACAALVLLPRLAWLAGTALVGLYLCAIVDYGWFHLLDYPLFMALGVILLLPRLRAQTTDALGLDFLRWSAAVTLMWGGIEKFAYPEWTFPLMQTIPALSLGTTPEAAMYMYGFGEVALSFALMLFGIGSQVAALVLLIVFVVAIPPFGWVDLVGHSGIVVTLVILTLTRSRAPMMLASWTRNAMVHAGAFFAVLVGLGLAYVGLHHLHLPSLALGQLVSQGGK